MHTSVVTGMILFLFLYGKVFFCIGDVLGHGIESAVVMVRARQSIISLSTNEDDPSIVLNRVNNTLLLQEPTLATAICGYINPISRQINLSSAGHPPPIIAYPQENPEIFNVGGICMGAFDDIECESHSIQARSGTTLILYTDGVVELNRNILEGEERLLALIFQARQQQVPDLAAYLHDSIFANTEATDDTTIMAISFT
jgi:sigma-B regulation protein RsbU (phosphoserine phosphatase)